MGQIPGNEIFPDVKSGYGTAEMVEVSGTVAIAGTGTYYKPGNARVVWIWADLTDSSYQHNNIKIRTRDAAGNTRLVYVVGTCSQSDTNSSQVDGNFVDMFVISGSIIPHEFALENDSTRGVIHYKFQFNY